MKRLILSTLTFFAIIGVAHSYEFYTFVDKKCQIHSGLISGVDKDNFSLWKLDGEIITLRRKDIGSVLAFDTMKNPYSSKKSSSGLRPFLRKVAFGKGESRESIIGWPYKFVEDLVFYISVENKKYVLSMGQISSIEKLESDISIDNSRERATAVRLDLAPHLPHCFSEKKKKKRTDYLRPTRTITDKIKIFVFFENLEKGYNRIHNFEDRTRVYARPFLHGKVDSRIAFSKHLGNREFNGSLPIYFQRTKGTDFGFQSKTTAGGAYQEWLPNVEPIFAVSSEIKSHFFNALFVGDIFNLPAGYSVPIAKDEEILESDKFNVTTSLNYLALMGFDYNKYSFSVGLYHPVYTISTNDSKIQILASAASPMFRFQYVGEKSKLRMFFSNTEYDQSKPSDEFDISFETSNPRYNDYTKKFEHFSFDGYNMRVGFDYQINSDLVASIDEVVSWGKYRQRLLLKDRDGVSNSEQSEFKFRHLYTSASLQRDMGDYVFIQLRGNYYVYKYKYNVVGTLNEVHDGTDFKLGVILGFIF